MPTLALALLSIAFVGDGRRFIKVDNDHGREHGTTEEKQSGTRGNVPGSFDSLASFLLAASPTAAQHRTGRYSAARYSAITNLNRKNPRRSENLLRMSDERGGKTFDASDVLRPVSRPLLRLFTDLRFAIGELVVLGILSALATIIPQNEDPGFYEKRYGSYGLFLDFLPDDFQASVAAALDAAFPSPGAIAVLSGFTEMFTSPVFLATSVGLAVSLALCSLVTQIPMAQTSRKWEFIGNAKRFNGLDASSQLRADAFTAKVQPKLAALTLAKRGYHVFYEGKDDSERGYAVKGIFGRFAPLGVHISLLMIILGAAYGSVSAQKAEVFVNVGESVQVKSLMKPVGKFPGKFAAQDKLLRLDDFRIALKPNGEVDQFYSDLALDRPGFTKMPTKTIKVNEPFVSGGLTVYQSDWKIASVVVKKRVKTPEGEPEPWKEKTLPMSKFRDGGTYASFLPIPLPEGGDPSKPYGISIIARTLNEATLFDPMGRSLGVLTPGSKVQFGGLEVGLEKIVGASGLSLKVDPGVKWVYAGFGGTMAMTLASFLPYNQVWVSHDKNDTYVGGKTNRLKGTLDEELKNVFAEAETR